METRARYLWVGIFTLAAILAGFAFVYWLNNSAGLGKRAVYRIRFEGAVAGLQTGSSVRFNGIRVGEVTALGLDPASPERVTATIAIDPQTPLRADTAVGVDFQGLMGSPAISLDGGTPASPLLAGSDTNPPTLAADPEAGQDLVQTARRALQRVDKLLADNSQGVKGTIDNLKTFTDALARNSDKIDGVLSGLQRLAGPPGGEKPKALYDLLAPEKFPPLTAQPKGQFVVPEASAVVAFETQHMLGRTSDGAIAQLGDAQWSDSLPKLVQEKIIQSFENAGYLASVAPPVERVTANYQLLIDLRNFAVGENPAAADIEFSVKIVSDDGHIVAARLIHASAPTKGSDAPSLVLAFNQAFGEAATDLVTWTKGAI